MDRRRFLTLLAAGATAALGACSNAQGMPAPAGAAGLGAVIPPPPLLPPPPQGPKSAISRGTLGSLPGQGSNLALTVDDGTDADVVGAYIQFAKDTGARFTFFVTAAYSAWTIHRDALRPLVESGQIQLGNHTWDHPDLTNQSSGGISTQLSRTKAFLQNNFGVDGTPYYRPPYGNHNAVVDKVAADAGYTIPTIWCGSLSDSSIITEVYLLECARKYFTPQSIVIGHANHPAVTRVYPQLVDLIRERNLSMVTLNDILVPPR